jgi:hypothetical protein
LETLENKSDVKAAAEAEAEAETEEVKTKAKTKADAKTAGEETKPADAEPIVAKGICSVSSESPDPDRTCFSIRELRQIADNVNRRHGSNVIAGAGRLTFAQLHARLKEVLADECDSERCWAEKFQPGASTNFVPKMPGSWVDSRRGKIKTNG